MYFIWGQTSVVIHYLIIVMQRQLRKLPRIVLSAVLGTRRAMLWMFIGNGDLGNKFSLLLFSAF